MVHVITPPPPSSKNFVAQPLGRIESDGPTAALVEDSAIKVAIAVGHHIRFFAFGFEARRSSSGHRVTVGQSQTSKLGWADVTLNPYQANPVVCEDLPRTTGFLLHHATNSGRMWQTIRPKTEMAIKHLKEKQVGGDQLNMKFQVFFLLPMF